MGVFVDGLNLDRYSACTLRFICLICLTRSEFTSENGPALMLICMLGPAFMLKYVKKESQEGDLFGVI